MSAMLPIAGPRFRRTVALSIEGGKRRRLVALVAAYHDGGAGHVSRAVLAERLQLPPGKVSFLVRRLEADGLLVRAGRRRWRLSDDLLEGSGS